MTPVPLLAPRPAPPNVLTVSGKADTAVSCHVVARAGSAAAPTATAPPSSTGIPIPSAPLRLKCMVSRLSVFCLRALPDHLAGSAADASPGRQPSQPDGPSSPRLSPPSLLD